MPRGSSLDRDQRAAVISGIVAEIGPTETFREMEQLGLFEPPHNPLDLRTIQRNYKTLKGQVDPSGPWSFSQESRSDLAPLVLESAWALSCWTQGRATVSRRLAESIKRVRIAGPQLSLETAFAIAWGYAASEARQVMDLRLMDLLLAKEIILDKLLREASLPRDAGAYLDKCQTAEDQFSGLLADHEWDTKLVELIEDVNTIKAWALAMKYRADSSLNPPHPRSWLDVAEDHLAAQVAVEDGHVVRKPG